MREMGLRRRVVLGFAGGALLLALTVTLVTDVVSSRYLVDGRDRSSTRQAVVNAAFVSSQLPEEDPDLTGALERLRLASGTEAVITTPDGSASSAIGLSTADLPRDLVERAASGTSGFERYRDNGTAKIAVAVPLGDDRTYFEVSDLSALDTTLRTIELAGVAAAVLAVVLGAALGAWLTRRTLRPLGDVATTATRLASGDLSARTETTTDPDLAPISSSFNAMAETLSARIQRDAQFAADVSHELRSPLTTMMASASVLEAKRNEMPAAAQQATDLMVTDLARFSALLEDLLDLARDHEPLDYLNLPVFDLTDTVRQELETSWRSDLVESDGDTRIQADQRRIRRVVANLVQNADVHGGGLTAVSVRRVEGGVRLAVSDDGLGVPESDREAVFERFSRGRSAPLRGDRGGTGLGLSLVRDHVTAHGGAAWYEESASGGACFVVELPAAR